MKWLREKRSEESKQQRLYEQERLITWTTEAVAEAMERAAKSRADLAKELGTSRAFISQLLSGSRNMTLRTLADLASACDNRAVVVLEPMQTVELRGHTLRLVRDSRQHRVKMGHLDADNQKEMPPVAANDNFRLSA